MDASGSRSEHGLPSDGRLRSTILIRPPAIPTQAEFCARYNECDLGYFDDECAEDYASARSRGAGYLTCVFDAINAQCPRSYFSVTLECNDASDRRIADACSRFCTARSSCEEMPVDPATCATECQMAFTDDPDQNERIQNQVLCIRENTCPTFNACVENASPEGQCERFCAARQACGDVEENCVAECNAQWPRDRHTLWRECVTAAADDCDAVSACTLSPTVPCAEACARRDECSLSVDRCVESCDDRQVAEPIDTALEVACILAAPICQPEMGQLSVADCIRDPLAAGTECLNFCRAKTECNPAADIASCLTSCVNGFTDAEGLRFNQARECLGQLPQDAECDALDACIPAEVIWIATNDQLFACQLEPADAPGAGGNAPAGGECPQGSATGGAPAGGMPAAGDSAPQGGAAGGAPAGGMPAAGDAPQGGAAGRTGRWNACSRR